MLFLAVDHIIDVSLQIINTCTELLKEHRKLLHIGCRRYLATCKLKEHRLHELTI